MGLQVFGVDVLIVFIVVGRFALPTAETAAAATAAAREQRAAHNQTLQGFKTTFSHSEAVLSYKASEKVQEKKVSPDETDHNLLTCNC